MADVDTVRLLADVTATDWPDASVQALLDGEAGAVKLAAADLLEVLAGRLQSVTSDDITVDGGKQAQTLMARAAALRTQHYEHGGDFFFDTTTVVRDYAGREWFNDDTDTAYDGSWC